LGERKLPFVDDQRDPILVPVSGMRKDFCERCDHGTFLYGWMRRSASQVASLAKRRKN
jgi:hypothetical protein